MTDDERTEREMEKMSQKQKDAVDGLLSELDELQIVGERHNTFVFEGYSVDGHQVGYINPDGTVEYMTAHFSD